MLGRAAFTAPPVLPSRPTTSRAPLPISLALIGVASLGATRGPWKFSWGHALIFRTVPSANTLVRWVNENAFAPIVRARPCPTFGRPVRPRGSPHRLRPGTSPHTLRIPPRGGHPVLRSSSSGGFRSALAVSGFRLRARLGFSIPSLSLRPARHYPRLWIRRSSSERRRDFNPPDLGAAQRTLWRGPTSRVRASSASAPHLPDADRIRHTQLRRRDPRPPRFRCDPFARDVAFDPGRASAPRIDGAAHVAFERMKTLGPCDV